MICLNNGWEYLSVWDDAFLSGMEAEQTVRLPHTVQEIPLHYADHESYQKTVGYRKQLFFSEEDEGKRHFLQFDGAAHIARVYCNGIFLQEHRTGYTGFRVEITNDIKYGQENDIVVKLDTTENGEVPPFGFAIDYLTFGGLYRDVWLDSRERTYLKDVYVATPDLHTARILCTVDMAEGDEHVSVAIHDEDGFFVAQKTFGAGEKDISLPVSGIRPWSPDDPSLYVCTVTLMRGEQVLDTVDKTFGFRTVHFTEKDFLLNGKPLFIRGLNRHQSYPYVGYAVPEKLQREDARILKEELHVNAVRTSHYPQSHYFLDECDRLGLLVFTEIPGWQHVGDTAWQDQAVVNTQEMIMQYRQHPSIILWGVRINESQDNDAFYKRTNETAWLLDPYRQTSGVRFIEKSSLIEDVYSYNDFSHNGTNAGVKPKKDVTPDMNKALIISEANGHMFPTKSFDPWAKRQEHAIRHARVLNDAAADGMHAGCFQWCMFDYPTHKDFGSGDRNCYHGVLDFFRNPKLAASVYASQQDDVPVLDIGSSMDIGDYPAGNIGDIYAFTNADEVVVYKNDQRVASFRSEGWNGLKHGPVKIDDLIGDLVKENEDIPAEQAELIHTCLNAAAKYGMANLPVKYKAMLGYCMLHYGMKYEDGVALYGKYVANWGGKAVVWRFDAVKNGKTVTSVTKCPDTHLKLEAKASHQLLCEGDTYDMAAVRIRVLDGYGNIAPYAQIPVHVEVKGPLCVVGPDTVTAEGGMTGTYLKTTGQAGTAEVTITSAVTEPVRLTFAIEKRG